MIQDGKIEITNNTIIVDEYEAAKQNMMIIIEQELQQDDKLLDLIYKIVISYRCH